MTASEARKQVKARLDEAGIPYRSIKARSVDFADLARCKAVFVGVDSDVPGIVGMFRDIPKPSEGGYIVTYA